VIGGVASNCQEFEGSQADPLMCDCCGCHCHFLEFIGTPLYERGCCKSNNLDFCQYFQPSLENEKKCGCCGCHKNFHEKVMKKVLVQISEEKREDLVIEKIIEKRESSS
jgi:hypothetical protein